jgi:hypothetical protein
MRTAKFKRPLTIALHPEVYEEIKKVTDIEARSLADWIRSAIDQALDQNKSIKEGKSNEHRVQ